MKTLTHGEILDGGKTVFTVISRFESDVLTVKFKGIIRNDNPYKSLCRFIEEMEIKLKENKIAKTIIDFTELKYCNSNGFYVIMDIIETIYRNTYGNITIKRITDDDWQQNTLLILLNIEEESIKKRTIFNDSASNNDTTLYDDIDLPPKYEKHRLSASKEDYYVKKLAEYMSDKKPYLKEELTLQDLADALSINTHHLSMILNIHLKQNFYNFINSYRVEEAKKFLSDPANKNANILAVAFNSGFNSKTTFNSTFKKFTGKTPKEYRSEFLPH